MVSAMGHTDQLLPLTTLAAAIRWELLDISMTSSENAQPMIRSSCVIPVLLARHADV